MLSYQNKKVNIASCTKFFTSSSFECLFILKLLFCILKFLLYRTSYVAQSKLEKVAIEQNTGIKKQLLCRAPKLFDCTATVQAQANM